MSQICNNKGSLQGSGCGCSAVTSVTSGSSCGCGTSNQITSAARYEENGECLSTREISCETKWQMRDCVKLGVCEFMICFADQVCPNGKFELPMVEDENGNVEEKDLGDVLLECLGTAFCSAAHCLPNAICAPRQNTNCIPPRPVIECNYAVEEKD